MASSTDAAVVPLYTPSVIILNPIAQDYVNHADVQIAPWIMGTFTDMFLQGILAVQTYNYITFNDGENKRRFLIVVIVLQILCILKSAQNIHIVWDTVVTNFANPDIAEILTLFKWSHYTTSFSTAVIATYVQSFFVYRYWLLTKRIWLCLLMLCVMVVSLVGSIMVIVIIPTFNNPGVTLWSDVHFAAAIVVDTLIVVSTAWHLYTQKTSIKSTMDMIDRLIRMTWQSALPPALLVLVNLIVLETHPFELSHIAVNMVAAKLYAISLLYTLNLRNELRGERMTTHATHERSGTNSATMPKRSFIPGDMSYRGGRRETFGGRHGGNKGEGVHVETHVSTHASPGLGSHAVELRDFANDSEKGLGTATDTPSDPWMDTEKRYR